MLSLSGVCAGYPGGGRVLDHVDLTVGEGETVALMGRNGMGKTTLLRTVMGHLKLAAGDMAFAGQKITGWPPYAISNAGIAYVPQGREVFPDFTVEENLRAGLLGKKGLPREIPAAVYARFPILAERRKQRAGTMSGGEQQQLAIARAIVGRPRLLLLDEPTEGIQPSIVHTLGAALRTIAAEDGIAVLLVEQNLELVLATTRRCVFMENGHLAHTTATPALAQDPGLLERFLGVR